MILTHLVLFSFFNGAGGVQALSDDGGGGYHRHRRQKALDWRVRDKKELERILRELGESPRPEIAERAQEIRQENSKKLSAKEAAKPLEERKPRPIDAAKLARDLEAARWLVETYDALMLAELELQRFKARRLADETAILLLM